MRVRVNIECDAEKAMQRLENMALRSRQFRPLFWYARAELAKANASNFTTGGLPTGRKWEPRTRPYAWPLMRKTGMLMGSLTSLFGPPNDIDDMHAEFGTDVEYAKFHQYGTTKMPARKIVFEPRGFARDLANKAAAYVANGVAP
jgi:phage gpG-like protein